MLGFGFRGLSCRTLQLTPGEIEGEKTYCCARDQDDGGDDDEKNEDGQLDMAGQVPPLPVVDYSLLVVDASRQEMHISIHLYSMFLALFPSNLVHVWVFPFECKILFCFLPTFF